MHMSSLFVVFCGSESKTETESNDPLLHVTVEFG